jgi:hypothetical protein
VRNDQFQAEREREREELAWFEKGATLARDPWFVALWFVVVVVVVVVGCIVKQLGLLAAMTVAQKLKSSPKLLPCAAKHEAMGAWLRGGWVVGGGNGYAATRASAHFDQKCHIRVN